MSTSPRPGVVLGAPLKDTSWFRPIKRVQLAPGELAGNLVRVPVADARQLVRNVVRLVADLPADASPDVVWHHGDNELLVLTDSVTIACTPGLVTITVTVSCDQLDGTVAIAVPIAVGTEDAPGGLVMSAFRRLEGPELVTSVWSDALTAFAWETLVELGRRLCAELGDDASGRPFVPGAIGAASRVLLVQPMARHALSLRAPT